MNLMDILLFNSTTGVCCGHALYAIPEALSAGLHPSLWTGSRIEMYRIVPNPEHQKSYSIIQIVMIWKIRNFFPLILIRKKIRGDVFDRISEFANILTKFVI